MVLGSMFLYSGLVLLTIAAACVVQCGSQKVLSIHHLMYFFTIQAFLNLFDVLR